MIAPIERTQAARGSSSQVSAGTLPVCEVRRGPARCVVGGGDEVEGDFGDRGDADVGGGLEVGGVDADEGVDAVVVGAPVGFSGNC
jgi:hypothetical protein